DLSEGRPRAGADVGRAELHDEAPVGLRAHGRLGGATPRRVRRRRDARADEPAAVAPCARRIAVVPAESGGAVAQARDEVARAEAAARLRVDVGLVADPQLDR